MIIFKEFSFDAAHKLPHAPEGHKCRNLHGHTYRVVIEISGEIDATTGWLLDFAEIKSVFNPILIKLDHQYLNDIKGLENPTAENIAIWLWNQLKPELSNLYRIVLYETPTSGVYYSGDINSSY